MFVLRKFRFLSVLKTFLQALENTEHGPYLNLLNVFAFGTFTSLFQNSQNLPQVLFLNMDFIDLKSIASILQVSDAMTRKLRLLTVLFSTITISLKLH